MSGIRQRISDLVDLLAEPEAGLVIAATAVIVLAVVLFWVTA